MILKKLIVNYQMKKNTRLQEILLQVQLDNEAKWQARVDELETKVAAAEKAAAEANGRIETVYVDRVQVVKEVQYVVQNRIAKDAAKIDMTCRVDPEAIEILNQAAHAGDKK